MDIGTVIRLSISLALEIWLIVLLAQRRTHQSFPIFVIFAVAEAVAIAARLLLSTHYRAYFYVYWCTEAILLPLSLAALHQVFHWMFEGFYRLWWFRLFYYGTIMAVLAIAVRNAIVSPPVHAHPAISLILDVNIAVNFVRIGIVAIFVVFDRLLLVEFRRYAYGIVVGFGISSGASLFGYLLFSGFGTKVESFTRYSAAVGYILGLAIWIAAFIRPEPEDKEWQPPMSPDQMLEEVQGYLRALGISKRKL